MKSQQVLARIVLIVGDKQVEIDAIVDAGASVSIISKGLAEKLGYNPLSKPYTIRTANRDGYLRIIGYCLFTPSFRPKLACGHDSVYS